MLVREIVILFCYCYSEVVLWDPPLPPFVKICNTSFHFHLYARTTNFIVIIVCITWLIAWSIYIYIYIYILYGRRCGSYLEFCFFSSFCTLSNCYIIIIFSRSWNNSSCIWWSECLLGIWSSNQSSKQSFKTSSGLLTKLANWGIYGNNKKI